MRVIAMFFFCTLIMAMSAMALASEDQAAEGHGSESIPIKNLIFGFINLILFLGILIYFARKPVANYYTQRAESVRAMVKEAHALLEDAKKIHENALHRSQKIDQEMQKIIESTQESARNQAETIIAAAKQQAQQLVESAKATVDAETNKAITMIHEDMVDKTIQITEQMIKEKISSGHQRALVGEYLNKLEGAN